jgi:hypothetical protein
LASAFKSFTLKYFTQKRKDAKNILSLSSSSRKPLRT